VFTTQAVRHDEFNVNLAYVAASFTGERVRGRLAVQAGTSVQANYAGEPAVGSVSGASLSRHIQEATVGARLAPALWIDGGIYLSYIGWESWISRDNPTYTRSLVADYTPYYLSGVHLTWQPGLTSGPHRANLTAPPLTIQLHVMNGWQNISENNTGKSVGARIDWQATSSLTLVYANFFGNEQPRGVPATTRVFNQVMAKAALPHGVSVQTQVDVGKDGGQDWYGMALIGRKEISPTLAIAARLERYSDPDQAIVVTGTAAGFVANGASIGLDVGRLAGPLWRTEVRYLRSTADLFPSGGAANASRSNVVLVTSLALTL
jgi:hypothetical protein